MELTMDSAEQHIDRSITPLLYLEQNWVRIYINSSAAEAVEWAEQNVKHRYIYNSSVFLFECSKDAAWFALKWA
jgi:hypothetical protein